MSSRSTSRVRTKTSHCFHGCHIEEVDEDLVLHKRQRCPGFNNPDHACLSWLGDICWKSGHRCGLGNCRCQCSECLMLQRSEHSDQATKHHDDPQVPFISRMETPIMEPSLMNGAVATSAVAIDTTNDISTSETTPGPSLPQMETPIMEPSLVNGAGVASVSIDTNAIDTTNAITTSETTYGSANVNETSANTIVPSETLVPTLHFQQLNITNCKNENAVLDAAYEATKFRYKFLDVMRGLKPSSRELEYGQIVKTICAGDTLYICNLYKGPATSEFRFLLLWKLDIGVLYAELLNDDTYTFLFDNRFIIDPNVTEESFVHVDSEQHVQEKEDNSSFELQDSGDALQILGDPENSQYLELDNGSVSISKDDGQEDYHHNSFNQVLEESFTEDLANTVGMESLLQNNLDKNEVEFINQNIYEISDDEENISNNKEDSEDFTICDDGNSLNIIQYDSVDPISSIPPQVLVDEKKDIGLLRRLYDFRFTVPSHIEVIGGRPVNLMSFHYRGVNAQNKTIKSKVLTFIDKDEKEELYRWELKGALITQFGNSNTRKREDRLYFSFCQLEAKPSPAFEQFQFILVAIMTTMCKDLRNDFLLWNKSIQRIEYCKDTHFIKYFWCRKDISVDYEFLLAKRKAYYDINRWIYKPNYSICRDYHNPGRVDDSVRSSEDVVVRAYNEWKLFAGNPVIESGPKRVPKTTAKMIITLPTKTIKPMSTRQGVAKHSAPKLLKTGVKDVRQNLKRCLKEQDNFGFNIDEPILTYRNQDLSRKVMNLQERLALFESSGPVGVYTDMNVSKAETLKQYNDEAERKIKLISEEAEAVSLAKLTSASTSQKIEAMALRHEYQIKMEQDRLHHIWLLQQEENSKKLRDRERIEEEEAKRRREKRRREEDLDEELTSECKRQRATEETQNRSDARLQKMRENKNTEDLRLLQMENFYKSLYEKK